MQHRSRARGQGCRGCWVSSLLHRTGNDGCPRLCPEVPCPAAPATVLALDGSQSQLVASTESKAPALQLLHTWAQLRHSSDTVGHSQALPTMTSPGLAAVSSVSHSPGVRGWAQGRGQAWVRQLTGSLCGVASCSIRVAPCSPIHTPGPTKGQRTLDLAHARQASLH